MVYLDPYLLLPWQQPLGVHAIVYAELFFPLNSYKPHGDLCECTIGNHNTSICKSICII